jgi:hypothetical protein
MRPCLHGASVPGGHLCRLYDTDPAKRAFWDGLPEAAVRRTAAPDTGRPCVSLGASLSGPQRVELGLSHARDWRWCAKGYGRKVEGRAEGAVCRCLGCGPQCPGYEAGAGGDED